MPFILSCLLFSFIGSLAGFFVHIFNGIVQSNIKFNKRYIKKTIGNFFKVLIVMGLVTLIISVLIVIIPSSFLEKIGTDSLFLHQLVYYLFAFAAFDFGIKNDPHE